MNNRGYITIHNVSGHDFDTITFYYVCKKHFRSEIANMFLEATKSTEDFVTHLAKSDAQPTHFKTLPIAHCDGDYHIHFFFDTNELILNDRSKEYPLVDLATFIARFSKTTCNEF